MKNRIISLLLCITMMLGITSVLSGCGGNGDQAFVIMTETLDGLFNPFFSTSASDGTIVSMTQIGMLTSATNANGDAEVAFGEDHAVVVLDYQSVYNINDQSENPDKVGATTYTFVIKNGIKFSDGEPLTIEDVLFNLYVYLDPVYTGSSTMYSTDIQGLSQYRIQQNLSGSVNADEQLTSQARTKAKNRINELINLFRDAAKTPSGGSYSATDAEIRAAINRWSLSEGYKEAVSSNPSSVTNEQLLKDYEKTLELFRKELESDYEAAKEAYTDEPYKSNGFDEITSFMYMEGYVSIKYKEGPDGKPDKSKIEEVHRDGYPSSIQTKEDAINYVFNDQIGRNLHIILSAWATATELQTLYTAQAKEVILKENVKEGDLRYPNITGIVSLGHTKGYEDVETVTIGNKTYTVAHDHNRDGTPANPNEYDVLQIKINGIDPKAVWNFSFAVAPQHYYAEGYKVDIANNMFGVDYASFDYMTNVIQSQRNVTVPMGAGPYMATNHLSEDNVTGNEFFSNNVVYFKSNPYFEESMEASLSEDSTTDYHVNIEKVRYQIVPTTDSLTMLQSGTVHYVTPQLTKDNMATLNGLASRGFEKISVSQLGYGYIGINASYIPNIYLRRAIMAAMDTSLALQYYDAGTAEQIFWPMSTVSWAYPKDDNGDNEKYNGHIYPYDGNFTESKAKENIISLMESAYTHSMGYTDSDLKVTFTIAGSNLTDHPTYQVFQTAAKLLNECGWDVEVIADAQALTKLSTGSLAVWAAAWGTTVDPDMYQVYHKNSNASSVRAWGYNAILSNDSYWMEQDILDKMSEIIDDARETDDQDVRTALYEKAMGYVLDLAVELPVYQRQQLYAYNANIIDSSSFPKVINPYSSPLDRIWELKFTENAAKGGSSNVGGYVFMGTLAFAGVGGAVGSYILPEERRNKIFKKKKPYVIPVDMIDEEDMNDYNKIYN